jgi:16S rRNA processing protein RimM
MLVPFGQFGRPHGVRGELRFRPFNPDSPLLSKGRTIQVGRSPKDCTTYQVERVRFDSKGAVVKIDGFFDRDQVRVLTGQTWYEMRDAFPELGDDEVYLVDLIGMDAVRESGELIGCVTDILEHGPYETLAIRYGRREVLVPYVEAFVLRIDMDARQIIIRPIEGLID